MLVYEIVNGTSARRIRGKHRSDSLIPVEYDFDLSASAESSDAEMIASMRSHLTANGRDELATAKIERMIDIDNRTAEIILSLGFIYQGKRFSCSTSAQLSLLGLSERDLRSLLAPYLPLVISTEDNLDSVTVSTTAEMRAMCLASFEAVLAARNAGNALKEAVRTAATVAAVAAIEDTR